MSKNNDKKIKALRRAQEVESMLKTGKIRSEALQSSGDDRPVDESHINELLEDENKVVYKKTSKRSGKVKAKKLSKKKTKNKKR